MAAQVPADLAFEVVELPGKGKGVVSTRAIKAGELILAESPAFTTGMRRTEPMITAAVDKLSASDRLVFHSLALSDNKAALGPFLGRMETNGIEMASATGAPQQGLFLLGSRFNHSCTPNICRTWDGGLGKERFVASVDIDQDIELEIYYDALYKRQHERQNELHAKFGFWCKCRACCLTGAELADSDQRRAKIDTTRQVLPQLIAQPARFVQLAKEALTALEHEGIYTGRGPFAYDCFQASVAWSDLEAAKLWAARNLELQKREAGVGSSEFKRMEALKANPKAHRSWGAFGRKQKVEHP
ncbi:hypothetical protein JCM3775_001525 [Rhodotorula graminis]